MEYLSALLDVANVMAVELKEWYICNCYSFLRKAHQANDRAVMAAYGMDVKATSEAGCVAELMRRYRQLCCRQ